MPRVQDVGSFPFVKGPEFNVTVADAYKAALKAAGTSAAQAHTFQGTIFLQTDASSSVFAYTITMS